MGDGRIDGPRSRDPIAELEPEPVAPRPDARASRDAAAAARAEQWIRSDGVSSNAAADAAWAAVARTPALAAPSPSPIAAAASCAPPLATPDNARAFATRGVPLGLALQRSAIVSVPDLEKFIDEYVSFTGARPELKGLHEDATRRAPEIFAHRLDREEIEQRARVEEQRMDDRSRLMVVRPPLVVQQRAAVGEVAIPIAQTVTAIGKFVPIAGELIVAAEVLTGKTIGGLGFDIPASERALSAAMVVAPYAASALKAGVRGAAELVRISRASGLTTEETRRLCSAVLVLQKNRGALEEGLAAGRAGRPLTSAQREAFAESSHALRTIRGAAANSRFDAAGQALMSRAEKAALPTFQPNAGGVERSLNEAIAIAEKNGVTIPDYIKIVADPAVPISKRFADYELVRDVRSGQPLSWEKSAQNPIVVRVHPSVLKSDEAIVGVLQHESYELDQLRLAMQKRGSISGAEVSRMIDGAGARNLHGQAWDVADLRVLIMREGDPVKKAVLQERLQKTLVTFHKMNLG